MLGARAGDAVNMLRDRAVIGIVNVTPRIFTEVRSMSSSGGGGGCCRDFRLGFVNMISVDL